MVLGICALLLAPILTYRMGLDQGVFAYIGAELLQGHWPYIATWDHAFPGAMIWHAAVIALFGKSVVMFRLADLFYQLTTVYLIYRITERVGSRAGGYLAAAVYALIYQGYGPWNTSQREGFALLWVLLAFWLFLTAERRARLRSAAGIGLCLGIAATFKPTLLATASMYAPLLADVRRSPWRRTLGVTATAAGALAAPLLAIVVFYWGLGGLRDLYEACIAYQVQVYVHRLRGDAPLWLYWLEKLKRLGGHAVGLAVAYPPFLLPSPARRERLMLFIGYLASAFTVFVQGTFAGYHYLLGLGLGSILIGSMFSEVSRAIAWLWADRLRRVAVPSLLAHAVIIAAVPIYIRWTAVEELVSGRFLGPPLPNVFRNGTVFDFTESYDVAAHLRARTDSSDFIQVWGHESLVYYLAHRDAASRFQTSNPLVMRAPGRPLTPMQLGWRREFIRDLGTRRPRYVVVVTRDNWWWAPDERTSEQLLDDFPDFKRLIEDRYKLEQTIGRFLVYRRVGA